jgi:cell division protein FtsQ
MAKATPKVTASSKTAAGKARGRDAASLKPTKKNAALQERARKIQQQRRKRYITVVSCVCAALLVWVGITTRVDQQLGNFAHNQWLQVSSRMGFQFKELQVEGRHLTDGQAVVEAVGLYVGDSLFLVSLDEIRTRLLALDTVKNAAVTRDLGGRILVSLEERVPFVLWQRRDVLQVMDDAGVVMVSQNPDDYPYLVTMVGDKAPEHIDNLVAFISSDPNLAKQIVAAVFVSDRRWDIHFANGVKILLPEMNPKAAWQKLAEMNRKHDILKQSVQVIDLRVDDRVFITLPEEKLNDNSAAPESDA